MKRRLSACLGSHWTARLGSKRQTQLGKNAIVLHRLSVGPWEPLGKGHSKRTFLSTLHWNQGMAGSEGTC